MIINIKCEKSKYNVIIKDNLLNNIKDYIDFPNKTMLITDSLIPWNYIESFTNINPNIIVYKIKYGEENKNIDNYLAIIKELMINNFEKSDLIIGLGGGVVGDLAGFVSATYKRGINYISVPTSMLAMVDSSIGGKNAINYLNVKNSLGTYYMPNKVLISLNTLKTLPKRHLYNGLMESLKMGLIGDKNLYQLIKDNEPKTIDEHLEEIIYRSINVKKKIVEKDPYEVKGIRKLLNYGHTIGHAIEILNVGCILHGEAIAYGMLPFCNNESLKRELQIIILKYILLNNFEFNNAMILEKIKQDKKWNKNNIDIVTLDNIGHAKIKQYTIKEIEGVINEINFWK